ncbi:DUF2157 domain-containing protein [Saccharothrix variisporea]|uniref:Putative membrane protein DUF2157 n=1 Tax=Saccharothrix variisporea TaxID=543527 RepID=A0A495XPX7_9PSEU|nr:DUF2157 domain-containing protein [Saccharothrix variisporea]RKT74503.1 putative membrane protein DUF2157 [Saccharothrix variisporea]
MDERQSAALHRLTVAGVISAEQERAVRDALDGVPAASSRTGRLVEIAGYVGGGLLLGGAVLLVATAWEDLSRTGRLTLLVAATAVLVAAGVLVAGGPRGIRQLGVGTVAHRVVGVLFALAPITAALAGGVAVDDREVLVGAAVGLPLAVAGYAVVSAAVGLLVAGALSVVVVMASVGEHPAAGPLAMGLWLFGLGVLWLVASAGRVLRHRQLGLAIGAVIAFFGAQQPLGSSDDAVWAYALTAVLAVACFAGYARERTFVLPAAGVVATTVVVPEAVWDWTDGAVGGGWLLLVGGAVLLAASGIGLRLGRSRPGVPVRPVEPAR